MGLDEAKQVPFERAFIEKIPPGLSGCYALFTGIEIWWIDGASDIKAKLLDHLAAETNQCLIDNEPEMFSYFETEDYESEAERLIAKKKPHCNKMAG